MGVKAKIGIIDCDFGNVASLINALKFLDFSFEILKEPKDLNTLSHLILPGVGSFNESIKKLRNIGWEDAMQNYVEKKKPLLGICLGMQLLFQCSTENGYEKGLSFLNGKCDKFNDKINISLPHIGFNLVSNPNTLLWDSIPNNSAFYFVHSYRITELKNKKYKIAKTFYGEEFISAIEYENIFGFQFHPEKSHKVGLKLIKNFIEKIR